MTQCGQVRIIYVCKYIHVSINEFIYTMWTGSGYIHM
jgi:hypothetical protein